jgi:hypothetical protein
MLIKQKNQKICVSNIQDITRVPQSHAEELDGRLKCHQTNPGNLLSLEELQTKIENRK